MGPIEFSAAGIEWVRNASGSVVSVRGPVSVVERVKAEVAARVPDMAALAPRAGPRCGACERCGVALEPHIGGWCELCCLARRVALKQAGVAL